MIKSYKSGDDPCLAILNLRNTPNEGMVTSPVQRLMGRRTQSVLPATPAVLKPSKIPVSEHSKLQWKRHQSAQHLCTRSQLPPLKPGDHVPMEPTDSRKEWRPATVTKALPYNNYEVWDGYRSFIRARRFLRKKPSSEPAVPTNNHHTSSSSSTEDSACKCQPTSRVLRWN
ncbi:integrase core domain [Plakobranchus ocellatus]|uniref:Integrase core domain n=1 Tax=Plakobranchus ocellatus TaxID=259542 RepID=A0AAV4BSL1_9GAST|nr:integrase core domain [Plakobranchus ocellatus]